MKSILAASLVLAGTLVSNTAYAGDYLLNVYCNGESPKQVVVTAQAVNYAVKIAEKQNPGCRAVFARKVN